jgi:hypothetical protein
MSSNPNFPDTPVADLSRIPGGYIYVGHGPLPLSLLPGYPEAQRVTENRDLLAGWCLSSDAWSKGRRWSGLDPRTPYAVEENLAYEVFPSLAPHTHPPSTHEF